MTKRRSVKQGFWFAPIVTAIFIYALLADWWKENTTLGWIILGVLAVIIAFLLYRFAKLRGWIGTTVKSAAEKIVFEKVASEREPLPSDTRGGILRRARNRCENERCNQGVRPHIHHIDGNNSNNRLSNLIAVCPNCHQKAHDGVFTVSQLYNWARRDFQRQKSRRARSVAIHTER
ncbi:HNH endonuclease [Chloroflexota bacterium]